MAGMQNKPWRIIGIALRGMLRLWFSFLMRTYAATAMPADLCVGIHPGSRFLVDGMALFHELLFPQGLQHFQFVAIIGF